MGAGETVTVTILRPRNIISHEYSNVDEVVIVSTINDDLPKLKTVIEELLTNAIET